MHKSRLAGLIIDCESAELDTAAEFWGAALGAPPKQSPDTQTGQYVKLDMPLDGPYVEVQTVNHASRVHLDIESDDIPAEVRRLEGLGAIQVVTLKEWVVMEAPTGQRFCVVPVGSADFENRANHWKD
ncbi:MAG: VOC family protein [Woeseiaceae bacterium]